jgi:hypothetical protein
MFKNITFEEYYNFLKHKFEKHYNPSKNVFYLEKYTFRT